MNYYNSDNYEDIINLPHHVSRTRPQMSLFDRAAQFSPFAALVGYDDEVRETARLTDEQIELTEERERELNEKLAILTEHAAELPLITVEYFVPDKKKQGGAYATFSGNLRRIDEYGHNFVFTDGSEIPIDSVCGISGEIFHNYSN